MSTHQMLEYIREEPLAVANTIRIARERIGDLQDLISRRPPKRVVFTGFGSSYTAACMAAPLLGECISVPVTVAVATELVANPGLRLDKDTLVVLVSRSGERGWLVDAEKAASQAGAATVAVTAVESSLLAREANLVIPTGEGPEAAFAKTKSVLASAVALMQIGLAFAEPSPARARRENVLAAIPDLLETCIKNAERSAAEIVPWLVTCDHALLVGSAGNFGVAQEAALKLQEASGTTAQYDNTGNALHGALGVIGPRWAFVALVTPNDYTLDLELLRLIGQFGAERLCISEPGLDVGADTERLLLVPAVDDPLLAPLVYLPPLQILTYLLAVARGLNPDKPASAEIMLKAMLPAGREEPDWAARGTSGRITGTQVMR
jgi:glucosamine--fructose-6-phosphate aminotransferase (isomerizing)